MDRLKRIASFGNSRELGHFMRTRTRVILAAVTLLSGTVFARGGEVDFAREIQPILSDTCYHCHGPDSGKRKADLRFDSLDPHEGPFAKRDGYVIIAPGKIEDSVLIDRITSDDPDEKMPPPKSNRRLRPEQVELIKRWVAEGAKWGKHWAFNPPVAVEPPKVKESAWVRNPIDSFILSRLEKEGIAPSPEASKETLIRRVTLDLTGLPPTLKEVDAFLKDESPDAYEKVVDRLLASPRYGEHMAWTWLEAARYADTNGYQGDPTRTSWPWRDWVINAFNSNMPYDQFLTWQLAGDLMPNATDEQRLATCFNRNHPFNGEGGRIPEETRVEDVMDRADTTSTVFLGLTMGCAKCHDHKYDPISQKEYYSFYAYFNQCSETGEFQYVNGGNVLPVMSITSVDQRKKLADLKAAAKAASDKLGPALASIDAGQAEWESSVHAAKGWDVTHPVTAKSEKGATITIKESGDLLVSGEDPENDVHEVTFKVDGDRIMTGLRLDPRQDASLPQKGPGRAGNGNFVLTKIEVSAASVADPKKSKRVRLAYGDATYAQKGFEANKAIDQDDKTGWAVNKAPHPDKLSAVFAFAEPIGFVGGTEYRVKLRYESEHKNHTMGSFRLSLTEDRTVLPPDVAAALEIAPEKRDDGQKTLVRNFYRARVNKQYQKLAGAADTAKNAATNFENAFTKVMVMDDATPRQTHVLVKGAYDKPADAVGPGVLAILNPMPSQKPVGTVATTQATTTNRLDLARWMTDPTNPLVARVIVNRYWQQFFGTGIVKTVEDFGSQGERPVHPELLDYLAVHFRDSHWDVKGICRMIVTSATYRQSSKMTPETRERDPENRLLARGARFRLPASSIRDVALASSGLLVEQLGGPPVKPYQPPGVWEEATFGYIKYEQDHGDALYRRSLYTFWRRIVGPTEMFDTASRSTTCVRPSRTNTPLHALTTLNDTTFVEAARALAQRAIHEGGSTAEERIDYAFRLVCARRPTPREKAVLTNSLSRLTAQYAADRVAAMELLSVGESDRDKKIDPVEHAAYTGTCLAILNLDEAITKE